ncbi:MAG TPA: lysophospholipid acyltransferase family protein [Azospirillaceae bacterium]|nr:lysophospholipid acyltransferase family protein [Azospirillaceae bacterium]
MDTGSTPAGILRLAAYLGFTFLCIPVQAAFLALGLRRAATRFPVVYHRICLRMLGIEVRVTGAAPAAAPVLFISNHSSYLDIPVLASVLPASFVAKSEVGTWPLFGLLAKLQRTVFVDRQSRTDAGRQRDSMAGRLQDGDSLILFPEGTSSDGNRTLPFKTALFSVAGTRIGERPVTVQPVSVVCTHLDGMPMGFGLRSLYAWYGDMELPPHLWRVVRTGRLGVSVEFHEPVTVESFGSRKALADHCWRAVASGVARAVAGRPPAPVNDAAPPPAQPAPGPAAEPARAS